MRPGADSGDAQAAADAIGRHLLLDVHGVAAALLTDAAVLEHMLRAAAQTAGATALFAHFHAFGVGQGVTGVLLLMESHISIHTWPEHGYAALDIFMCGHAQPQRAVDALLAALAPQTHTLRDVARGSLPRA
ncbi:adenosylmethionine decarboxylase [Andreprevotia sp. IGB-42]|uniref:adenosylmethionine decarboxylase n=1 Tax=Andreprevotia sp. IGB-42 TaxID=2497473 RepID=UPI00191DFC7F|nr:adenosylmethionine decarboxylase [Andreprevotia sp. IGB-42]